MFWYLVFMAILFGLNLAENNGRRGAGVIAAWLLALVAGLRYETGFDWVEYENIYLLTGSLGQPNIYAQSDIQVEAGWEFVSSLLRTFGLGFQWLLALVAFFNFYVLYKFIKKYSNFTVIILIWYYGFGFLSGQMAAIRSCAGISFLLLAFMYLDRSKPVSVVLAALSGTFHAFSFVIAPFVYIRARLPDWRLVAALTLPALGLVSLFGFSVFRFAVQTLGAILPAGIATAKLELYGSSTGATLSPLLIGLLAWHFFAYYLISRGDQAAGDRRILKFAGWVTILNIVAHCYFPDYPVFWNRVMLLSFFLQSVALAGLYEELLNYAGSRALIGLGVTAASCGSIIYSLNNSQALAFKPYQSTLVVMIRGDYGDGRVRYAIVRREIDDAAAEARRAAGVY